MALPSPPPGFTALNWAVSRAHTPQNVIGVCVDYLEPVKSKGSDYTSKFALSDPTWQLGRGQKFRLFQPSIKDLPAIKGTGDVVILRDIIFKDFNGECYGCRTPKTTWVVLPASSIIESEFEDGFDINFVASVSIGNRAPAPSKEELRYAKEIVKGQDSAIYRPPPKRTALEIENTILENGGTPPARKERYRRIEDLTAPVPGRLNFADLFGEVRKYWDDGGQRGTLSLTDYTTNKLLYNHEKETGGQDDTSNQWPGPWGRMTIEITLWDSHAVFAKSQIRPGQFVLVRNCQIKYDRNESRLEAVCRGDRNDPSQVNLLIQNQTDAHTSSRFKSLLERRSAYGKQAKAEGLRFGWAQSEAELSKKRMVDSITNGEIYVKPEPTNPTKKESKHQKRKRQKAAKQNANSGTTAKTPPTLSTNEHVRCKNISIPLTTLSSILSPTTLERTTAAGNKFSLPFQNSAYKVKVRVVDYYPYDLADFSVPYLVTDHNDSLSTPNSPTQSSSADSLEATQAALSQNPHKVRWEWRFFLVVEDPLPPSDKATPTQMALLVSNTEAEHLLNQDASDLHHNPQDLAKLAEKLFVLWGDLQEQKDERAQSVKEGRDAKEIVPKGRPFECFIREYGVEIPPEERDSEGQEWTRMFGIHGTSI